MIARLRDVTYHYPHAEAPALNSVHLDVAAADFVLVAGPSAGGKSTLLRTFNGLVPQFHGGTFHGSISVDGWDPSVTPTRRMAHIAGMVFQEPEAQGVGATVEDDIAFSMEQQGIDPLEMHRRLEHLLPELGIAHLGSRALATLSGGERQRAAIGAALALEPGILLCDEPTSQLDPAGAAQVAEALAGLHRRGATVILAEHRLERFLPLATAVASVEAGCVRSLTPREAAATLDAAPAFARLATHLGLPPPLTPEEAAELVDAAELRPRPTRALPAPGDEMIAAQDLRVTFGDVEALRGVSLTVREGEVVALMGANGCGKTTLLRTIAGLVKPTRGNVLFRGTAAPQKVQQRSAFLGLVPQDPAVTLYRDTVETEIASSLRYRPRDGSSAATTIDQWQLGALAQRNPRDLSVGQQLRVAVAAMLAHRPPVWLLDEPTRGADVASREWLAAALRHHAAGGGTAIVATHDIDAAASFATRVVGMEQGEAVFDLPARQAFGAGGPYATSLSRVVPWAVTLEDIQC